MMLSRKYFFKLIQVVADPVSKCLYSTVIFIASRLTLVKLHVYLGTLIS